MWIETTEGAKFWMKVFNDLKTRGVNDILIAVTDGLTGMPAALAAVFPRTTLQTCIVHLIRNSLDNASWKDRKMLAKALRPIYAAASAEAAEAALDAFADGEWGRKFPTVVAAWRRAWAQVIPFFAFPPEIRRVIYTTDEIDKPLVDRIGCFSVRSRRAVFPSRPGSRRRRAQRRSRVILVANSGAQPDQATICRAANCEMRVFAERVSLCHSATLTRLTATAVMTCCKRVFANPM